MGNMRAKREVEVKLAVASAPAGRKLLQQAGFRVSKARVFETNTLFDTGARRLLKDGALLRVREAGGQGLLTYKGPATAIKHKSREELETEIADPETLRAILARLEFEAIFRYEKFRTEYARPDGTGHIMLDETPIGVFLELEGPPRWIDGTARTLGFSEDDYITASYGRLYLDYCKANGIRPANMVYETSKSQPKPGLSEGRV